LAGAKGEGQGRARPRFTVGKEREHRRTLLFDGHRQHDDLARMKQHQRKPCAFDLHRQRSDTGVARGAFGAGERSAHSLRPEAPHRDRRNDLLVGDPRLERHGRWVELCEHSLGLIQASNQEEPPDIGWPRHCNSAF
jgi:hypothetical protein